MDQASYWNRWTALYRAILGNTFQAAPFLNVEIYANRCAATKGMLVYDAGCGVGGPSIIIADLGCTVVGSTLSQVQFVSCLQHSNFRPRLEDFRVILDENETYDLVTFNESIGYSNNLLETLAEAFRVLKPGGYLYVKDFAWDGVEFQKMNTEVQNAERVFGFVFHSWFDFINEFQRAGFTLIRGESITELVDVTLFNKLYEHQEFREIHGEPIYLGLYPCDFLLQKPLS